MKVLIAGGRGRVGAKVADALAARGVDVVSGGLSDGVDYISGAGVAAAMVGVDTIINVLNTDRFDRDGAVAFFEASTRTLTSEGQRAGVTHHILLSIVGVGDENGSDIGYYVGKVAQERAVRTGGIPFTIVRSTQFQSYVPVLADQHTVDGAVRAPRDHIQPVELDELVALLVEVAVGAKPLGEVEIAGPERFHLDDLLRATLAASADPRPVITVESTGAMGALVPHGAHRVGEVFYPLRDIPLAE